MKNKMKIICLNLIALLVFSFSNAQNGIFKTGVHVGLPIAEANNNYSLNLGVDLSYAWKISDKFSLGLATGYTSYSSKRRTFFVEGINQYIEFKPVAAGYIPIVVTGQYSITNSLFLGVDLGYAIYNEAADGSSGLIYQPKFGFQTKKTELYIGYKVINLENFTMSSINLGFNYKF